MKITEKLLTELQNRLKVGNRRGVHLNAIPGRSRYKFDLARLSHIDKKLPNNFIDSLLTKQPLKFKISWKDNVPDLNSLFEEDQTQLVKITKSFENLINQTEAIESEKGINTFGFGFPILIRRDQTDSKLTVATVLIWSLRIKRAKEFNTWVVLRNEDDPIYINEVLINHLQSDSKIEIDQLSSELLDDGLIDKEELLDICINLIEATNSTTPDDLRETFATKLDDIKPIRDKKQYEQLPLNSSNSFIDFGGLFSIFEVQKQNIIHDYGKLLEIEGASIDLENMDKHYFQPISSIETDPSQQSILHSLQTTRNILIQGPPGTGKSQSLTAILVNALESHKKTIVVCEKRTALEVLHNSLNNKGLGRKCILIKDIVKDRKLVVDSVRARVDNSAYKKNGYSYSKETLDNIIIKAKSLIDSINKKHLKLGENLIENKNWTHVVGNLISELKSNNEDFDLELKKSSFKYNSKELNKLLEIIRVGHDFYKEYYSNVELSFLNSKKFVGNNPYLIEQQINEDFAEYNKDLSLITDNFSKYENEYYSIRNSELDKQINDLSEIETSIQQILSKHELNTDFFQEDRTNGVVFKTFSIFSKKKKETLSDQKLINSQFEQLSEKIKSCIDFESISIANKSIKEKASWLARFKKEKEIKEKTFKNQINVEFHELNILEEINQDYITTTSKFIKNKLNKLKARVKNDNWVTESLNHMTDKTLMKNIKDFVETKELYFKNENDLFSSEFNWFSFYNSLTKKNKSIIDELKEKNNWRKVFLIYYLNSILVSSADSDLPINDNDHIELQKSTSELEKEQLKYIKDYWYSKQISATRKFYMKNPDLSVENLYNKRSSFKHRRISLRNIVKFDIDLFTTFFPVILTTPDVCSNLFNDKNQYFDIVMFDEASQLKLEDNLPALLKGKQIIIAGDEHQMPPSIYFSKIFDGTIDDEDEFEDEEEYKVDRDDILLSCESLLDFATELSFEKKHLDFHYRSRHPYLIDFSNYAFYNQRLKPLPNGFDYSPIKYIQVNGTYSDHTNEVEAETVLSIIENNIDRLPNGEYPTVGIATFNIAQRNLIKSKLIERRKFDKYNKFNDKVLELEENGLFVKNLENIQGDERDVIILSTTYGYSKDGKFAQRFGPINHKKGYKLLNVIITRAKYKVYTCTSIPEEVFLDYKEVIISEGANNRRGVFYAYLAYSKAVSENDTDARLAVLNNLAENSSVKTSINTFNDALESPFEEEVYQALIENFDESKIFPQFQFAGFRIDLVYDTKRSGLPKIAIECDGATYHSSHEAYLHDSHRQKILEGNGFIFHRIWSTNWWRNQKRETKKLVDFIQNIENNSKAKAKDKSNIALAFTDNISIIENELHRVTPSLQVELEETIEAVSKKTTEKSIFVKNTVKKDSKVKIKYLNNGKNIKIQLTDKSLSRPEKSNGVQKINISSPLATSLLGKAVGETVKVGNLDNYVEIMEID